MREAVLQRFLYKKALFSAIRAKSVRASTLPGRVRLSTHAVSSESEAEDGAPVVQDVAADQAPAEAVDEADAGPDEEVPVAEADAPQEDTANQAPAEPVGEADAGPNEETLVAEADAPQEDAADQTSAEAVGEAEAEPGERTPVAEADAAQDIAAADQAPTEPAAVETESAPEPEEDAGVSASIVIDPADLKADDEPAADAPVESALSLADEDEAPCEDEPDVDLGELRKTLMALQQQIRAAKIPVVIVFEGWDAAGKGTMVSKLIEGLDPRGYQVYPIRRPTEAERGHPPMRRYWVKTPAEGNISIFCSSWYREVSNACFESKAARKRLPLSYNEIINLESELVCDGVLLIKFFLHISRKEQKLRLKKMESKKNTRWRVEKEDWEQNAHYEDYLRLYDAMIARTHFDGMLWHVVRSDNKRACVKQIYDVVIDSFRAALRDRKENRRAWDTPFLPHMENTNARTFPQLDTFDPEQALTDPYKPAVDKAQKRLCKLQNELYRRGIPMVIGFEGWDAAGKGGAIRRLTSALDARGFTVVPIAAPTPLEKSHHYLWRFWQAIPQNGQIVIFDRTWYGRVMVERIEGYCTESEWKRAYDEINRFEAELAAHGVIQRKFWLQIDNATQLSRFKDRETAPDKQWKITAEDWRNREKWPQYEVAVNEMLQKTNTAAVPWTVVEANNKQFARLKVLHTVIRAIEERLEEEKE